MNSIAIIDDNPVSMSLAKRTLERAGFTEIRTYSEPIRAIQEIRKAPPSLILVDYVMPDMDGIAFIDSLRREGISQRIPIALMSDSAQVELVRTEAFRVGVIDVLRKPLNPHDVGLKLRNLARLMSNNHDETLPASTLTGDANHSDQSSTTSVSSAIKSKPYASPQEIQLATFLRRAATIRDEDTGMHTTRMAQYAGAIARAYSLNADEIDRIITAAPLHDIGMISIPDSIISRLRDLPSAEEELMQSHTVIGHQLLQHESMPLMNLAAEIALAHHEAWDGSGYPNKLKGESIPIAARIVAVADTFDCWSCLGQESQAASMESARRIILSNAGVNFDPKVVEAFIKAFNEIQNIKRQFDGNEIYRTSNEPRMLKIN